MQNNFKLTSIHCLCKHHANGYIRAICGSLEDSSFLTFAIASIIGCQTSTSLTNACWGIDDALPKVESHQLVVDCKTFHRVN